MKQICINSGGLPESLDRRRGPGTVADLSYLTYTLRSPACHVLSNGVKKK